MLITEDDEAAGRARHLASQAREPAPHYEHVDIGFKCRRSNLLAAVRQAQSGLLDDRIVRRRRIAERYRDRLGGLPGAAFPAELEREVPNDRLTGATIDLAAAGADCQAVRRHLPSLGIEARP